MTKMAMRLSEEMLTMIEAMFDIDTDNLIQDLYKDLYILMEEIGPMEFNMKIVSESSLLDENGARQEDIIFVG